MLHQSTKVMIRLIIIVILSICTTSSSADTGQPWTCDISEEEATQIAIDYLKSEIGWSEERIRESFSFDGGCWHTIIHNWIRFFDYNDNPLCSMTFLIDAHNGSILYGPNTKMLDKYKNGDPGYFSGEWFYKEKEWLQQMEAKYQTSSKYWNYKIWHELQMTYPLYEIGVDYALPSSNEIGYDQAVQIFINEYTKRYPDLDEEYIVCLSSKFVKQGVYNLRLPPEPNFWIMEFYEKNDFRDTPIEDRYLATAVITSEHGYLYIWDLRKGYPHDEITTLDDFWR